MPNTLEDDLKLDNWLSILTYDIAKYVAAGGHVTAVYAASSGVLLIQLDSVDFDKTHSKFRRLVAPQEPTEETNP